MAVNHYFEVFSNDGSTTLFTSANTVNNSTIITVTETGLTIGTETYTYSGEKKFIGVSGSASTTSPDYAIGESFDGGEASIYIVEEEPTTSGVTVSYNGSVVATITTNQKATLACNGKKMKTDIIVEVPETFEVEDKATPIEVSTETEMTALLESGEIGGVYKYTGTTGTYENGALYVLENATISFTVDGTSYEAEDGMTWSDYVNSSYNPSSSSYPYKMFYLDDATNTNAFVYYTSYRIKDTSGSMVQANNIIDAINYETYQEGGSGN